MNNKCICKSKAPKQNNLKLLTKVCKNVFKYDVNKKILRSVQS